MRGYKLTAIGKTVKIKCNGQKKKLHFLMRSSNFILELINILRGDPSRWCWHPIIKKRWPWPKCAVHELEQIISIHCCKHGVLHWGFICKLVHAWGAYVAWFPILVSTQHLLYSHIHCTNDLKIAIICTAQLLGKMWTLGNLHRESTGYVT